jgi:hypothetical protein
MPKPISARIIGLSLRLDELIVRLAKPEQLKHSMQIRGVYFFIINRQS